MASSQLSAGTGNVNDPLPAGIPVGFEDLFLYPYPVANSFLET